MAIQKTYEGNSTRLLQPRKQDVGGVVGDAGSAILQFKFPAGYKGVYDAFVEFDVELTDSEGVSYYPVYPLDSNNSIAIPSVISIGDGNHEVNYNLKFVSKTDPAVIERSAQATLYFYASANGTATPGPDQPDVLTYLSNNAYIDVEYSIDAEEDRPQLTFSTYTGTDDTVILNMPYLDLNGYISSQFINPSQLIKPLDINMAVITGIDGLITTGTVTSAELAFVHGVTSDIQSQLNAKLDDSQLVTAFQANPLDTNIASEKLVKDTLDTKVDENEAITANTTLLYFPSYDAKGLVTGYIDQAYAKTITINGSSFGLFTQADANLPQGYYPITVGESGQLAKSNGSGAPTWITLDSVPTASSTVPVTSGGTLTALNAKLDDSQLVTAFQATPLDTNIPSEKLVKDSLDAKLDDSQLVDAFQATPLDTNIPSEKLVKDSLDAKLDDSQLKDTWTATPSDTNIASEKLVKDTLDAKVDENEAITANTTLLYFPSYDAKGLVTGYIDQAYAKDLTVNGTAYGLFAQADTALPIGYYPTSAGTLGQLLKSEGEGVTPTWIDPPAGLTVIDNLTTQSSTSALSAKQGYVLDTTKVTSNTAILAGTGIKLSYDAKGLITGTNTLLKTDIPALDYIPLTGSSAITGSLIPTTTNSIDVGSSTKQYNKIYGKEIYYNGTILGDASLRAVDTVPTDASMNLIESNGVFDGLALKVNIAQGAGNASRFVKTDASGDINTYSELSTSDIPNLDASKINSGIFDISRIPQGAIGKLVIVADDTARFALTTATVQNGDSVKVTATGLMYYVIDDTQLSVEAGYSVYYATTDWSLITNKPSSFTPSAHASSANTYGVGDATNYGHVKTIENLTTASATAGFALGAYQGYLLDTNKVSVEAGKGLSTNDYTTAEKNKLTGIATSAQVNVIEAVKLNGTALTITSKAVDVTVPVVSTTTPIINGTAAIGDEGKWADGKHVHPTDTSRAPTSHASTANTYGVGDATNYGHVKVDASPVSGSGNALSSGGGYTALATKQANITTTTGTLTVAGWSAKSQTISITGVTATTKSVRVSYAVASRDAYLASGVHCTAQGAGTLTFVCDTTPTAEITVNVELAE